MTTRFCLDKAAPGLFPNSGGPWVRHSDHLVAIEALKTIAALGPDDQPEEEDYDDTESAYNNGQDCAYWHAAQLAKSALKALRTKEA